jgi:hypothetical protein
MSECIKLKNFKYSFRNSPPYPANKCKTMKKKGNDGKLYLSQPDKNGTYKWYNVNKNVTKSANKNKTFKNASKKDLQMLAKKYSVTKSGSNRELAERLVQVKGFVIKNKRDRKIIEQFLKTQTHHAKVYGFKPANK